MAHSGSILGLIASEEVCLNTDWVKEPKKMERRKLSRKDIPN